MSNQSGDTIFEFILNSLSYLGALLHWCLFLGRKPFSKVIDYRFLNGIIGIIIIIASFFLFKNEILSIVLNYINEKLNK